MTWYNPITALTRWSFRDNKLSKIEYFEDAQI